MVTTGTNKAESRGEAQVERAWMSAEGFHQPRHTPATLEEVPQESIQWAVEHPQDEMYPADTCRNLTLPELLSHDRCLAVTSDSEITKT